MAFLHWNNYKINCILSNTTFEIPLFLIKEVLEQTAAFDYYKYGYFPYDQQMRPSKKVTMRSHLLLVFLFHFSTFLSSSGAG